MKASPLSWIQKSIYSACVFFGTLIVLSLAYAATSYYSDLPNTYSGSGLTATSWNNLVNYANKAVKQETEVLTVTGGKVGIGKTNPAQTLDVSGAILASNSIIAWSAIVSNGTISWFSATDRSAAGSAVFYRAWNISRLYDSVYGDVISYSNVGNVWIWALNQVWDEVLSIYKWNNNQVGLWVYTTNPSYTNSLVRVQTETAPSTSWKLYEGRAAGGGVRYYVDGAGNGWFAGTVTQSSDERLKKDIFPIDNPLEKLSGLRWVTYYWKDEHTSKNRQIGVIAQEVEKIFPEAVATDEKGMKSVSYGNLIGPLIEGIKELKKENDLLKQENSDIRSRLDKLEQR